MKKIQNVEEKMKIIFEIAHNTKNGKTQRFDIRESFMDVMTKDEI